ncbi:ABC transporter substrate-binding protein [Phycicoccus endophyticus]|uniref:ABC transporter substrate-binding protein n=1 Tax=Phycicoccus endophyticus TaxID=1690220 RepID=A0A7G9R197_9MICO|nr:ABC transporter substrate-binding protein [Phycicoccus endophyticus]NHI18855.1 ABC transporter substrate-binding protein [Phycicoccus endophyticus]QNN49372.1 ABC transporter substrate-binding protein [Phycicoccus endophyticus]GGL35991.1 ABC transporter substrate-binding protein [Phycicoccus endophyticus]
MDRTPRALRRLLSLLAAVVLLGAVAACSSGASDAADPASSSADGQWTYTDDRGEEVTLDAQPTRIASFTDYAIGMYAYGLEPVALFGRVDVDSDPRLADYDTSAATVVGNSYGEIDLEALAAAEPDLIVTGIYPTDRKGTLDLEGPLYGFADVEQQTQLEQIAPVVAIEVGGAGADVIDSFNSLATALGVSEDTIASAKAEFDAAGEELEAAATSSGLEVTQMYADADGIYLVKPADEPETQLYSTYGVDFTDLRPDGDYYWDIYSWENASRMMTGDVLLVNVEGYQEEQLKDQATFASHPALQAGQVYTWNGEALDYASQADHMTELARILRDAHPVASS